MFKQFASVKIRAIMGARGQECHQVADLLAPFVGAEQAGRLVSSLGFSSVRYFPKGVTMGDAATKAALTLYEREHLSGNDFDACIFVTQTPNSTIPANTFVYQPQLGLSKDCLFLDTIQGCAGYVYGLFVASTLIASRTVQRVLLLIGDTTDLAHNLTPEFAAAHPEAQLSNAAIFGDGASATILEYDESAAPSSYLIDNYGASADVVKDDLMTCLTLREDPLHFTPHLLHIDGTALARFAMQDVRSNIATICERTGMTTQELAYCISHQANRVMLKSLERSLKADPGFVPFLAEHTGNASSASIPLALSEHVSNLTRIKSYPTLLTGYGVGLCVASGIVDLRSTTIYDPIEL